MAVRIRRVDYFYALVHDQPGEGYRLLVELASLRINLLAFAAIPMGRADTQLALFPEDTPQFVEAARRAGFAVDGPHRALLVQGDDELGALAGVHQTLFEADVNVFASHGVTDGRGSYGYVMYVRAEDYDRAASALAV